MSKQYVQHISGQGNKWEADETIRCEDCWHHHDKRVGKTYYLPKSEYKLCDPPERWVNVTEQIQSEGQLIMFFPPQNYTVIPEGYRIRKVQIAQIVNKQIFRREDGPCTEKIWDFLVEKRMP